MGLTPAEFRSIKSTVSAKLASNGTTKLQTSVRSTADLTVSRTRSVNARIQQVPLA
jgi:hypothetical protein